MTREQKERYVIELLKQNKGTRYIAERAHKSFRDIGRIRKKMEKEAELEKRRLEGKGDNNNGKSKSQRTQAIKLFSEGKDARDIVIDLDLPPERVRSILREYLEMKNMYNFLQAYEQIKASGKYSFRSFLRLYMTVNDLDMSESQITKVLELSKHNQLEHLQWKVEHLGNEAEQLGNEVTMLRDEKWKSTNDILRLTKIKDGLAYSNRMLGSSSSNIEYGGIEISWRYPELDYFDDKQTSDRY